MSRWRVNFWLDDTKPDELAVGQVVLELKKKRQFAGVIRDGIRLITSLRDHQIDVLLSLFPWVEDAIRARMPAPTSAPDTGDLQRQIADLKRVIMQQGIAAPPVDGYPVMKPSANTLGAGRAFSLPTFDDDDQDTIVIQKATGDNGQNFQNSLAKLGLF